MNRIKHSMKARASALLGLATLALAGSAQAVVLHTEDFEGGTPTYSINGVNGTGAGQSWELLTATTAASMVGTDYLAGATSRNGIVANGDPTDIGPLAGEPTGQHGFVSTSSNRHLSLATGNLTGLSSAVDMTVSFSFMSYALDGEPAVGSSYLYYSELGDFTDAVILASFGVGQAGSAVETPTVALAEETWGSFNLTFTEAGAGITFADTAAIRIGRVALAVTGGIVNGTTTSVTTDQITFFDDVTVSATIPEPSTAALLGLAGLALIRRRRN